MEEFEIKKKKYVFVLEDNEELRELFTILLEGEAYDFTGCNVTRWQWSGYMLRTKRRSDYLD
jgi:hypothetical protein